MIIFVVGRIFVTQSDTRYGYLLILLVGHRGYGADKFARSSQARSLFRIINITEYGKVALGLLLFVHGTAADKDILINYIPRCLKYPEY